MSIPLQPQETFAIVRQLQDHTDSSTYYVRATIRDSKTDELLETLNLTEKGSNTRRFSRNWQVSPDPSGLGRFISILTEVFTDSGYTTKASNYGDEMQTYKVIDQTRSGGGGSLGVVVDYKKIKKMIDEGVESIPKPQAPSKVDLKPVMKAISKTEKAVKSIKMPAIPKQAELNLQPVISQLNSAQNAILEAVGAIPGRDKNDIKPLADALHNLDIQALRGAIEETMTQMNGMITELKGFTDLIPELKPKLDELSRTFGDLIVKKAVASPEVKETTPKGPDDMTMRKAQRLMRNR